MPGQRHSQPTPTSLGQGCSACLGVTCHLHFWQNDRGLLRATAVTREWNGHRIIVSTQRKCKRTKFSRRSCWDSNSQPFNHESGALTNKLSRLPDFVIGWVYMCLCVSVSVCQRPVCQCVCVSGCLCVSVSVCQCVCVSVCLCVSVLCVSVSV